MKQILTVQIPDKIHPIIKMKWFLVSWGTSQVTRKFVSDSHEMVQDTARVGIMISIYKYSIAWYVEYIVRQTWFDVVEK